MPLSNSERYAKWRQKQLDDPVKREQLRQKERDKYLKKKQKGIVKPVSELSAREHRQQKKTWRINQRNKRSKDKYLTSLNTPPPTPEEVRNHPNVNINNRQDVMRQIGRQRIRRDRAQAYRRLFQMQKKLASERRAKEKYRKRFYRLQIKLSKQKKNNSSIPGKSACLFNLISNRIKMRYTETKSHKEKMLISSLICSRALLKKYRLVKYARRVLGIQNYSTSRTPSCRQRQIRTTRFKMNVSDFFDRDDNSRIKAGKKATITKKGEKKQIRLLCDDLKTLHAKYNSENVPRISYSLFCKLKPFYIIKPTSKDRDTCLCKTHENIKFKLDAAKRDKMLTSNDLNEVIKQITCSNENKTCMYRDCMTCKDRNLRINIAEEGKQVKWYVWRKKSVECIQKDSNDIKIKSMTVKDIDQGSQEVLAEEINNDIPKVAKHIFNINHQYKALRELREKIKQNEILIHIDFSENYNCKYASEVQSIHFGASKRQISLHTGVAYVYGDKCIPFCTMSDCLKHCPSAVWAHLDPILKQLSEEHKLDIAHFISDGPTTQYRNKQNFFLLSNMIYKYNLKGASWNFLEAGHGKGAADGIGAAIKRQADNLVLVQGKDITKAQDLLDGLSSSTTSVRTFHIKESDIVAIEDQLPKLTPLPATMKIHQLTVRRKSMVSYRVLSCFCQYPDPCRCFNPVEFIFPDQNGNNDKPVDQSSYPCTENVDVKKRKKQAKNDTGVELTPLTEVADSLISSMCIVKYDKRAYPGIIEDIDDDESIEVKAMHSSGVNHFYWPTIDDRCWYKKQDVLTLLQKPLQKLTKRLMKVDDLIWKAIEHALEHGNESV